MRDIEKEVLRKVEEKKIKNEMLRMRDIDKEVLRRVEEKNRERNIKN